MDNLLCICEIVFLQTSSIYPLEYIYLYSIKTVSGHFAPLTFQHHFPKHRSVPVQCTAIPAMIPELVLAFLDPHFGALSQTDHHPRVHATEAALSAG